MKSYALLLVSTVVGVTTAVPAPWYGTFTECKHYAFCCDEEICNNNCEYRPICDPWPDQGTPSLPIAIDICEKYFQYDCCRDANGCGDPHFQTWGGEWFDFHGECDLNFVHAPSFGKGIGLDIHVRTKIRSDFSYIEAAAVKVGNDVVVFGGWGELVHNGVLATKDEMPGHLGSFQLTHDMIDEATHNYHIFVRDGQALLIKSYKDYVSVKFEQVTSEDFADSKGLLGDFISGKRLGRDGSTVIENDIDYGMEWQVRPAEEPLLFESSDLVPQYPQKCNMPPMTADGRRLAEAKVSDEVAEAACAHMLDEAHKRMCIYDVQATGELGMATAGAF